MDSNKKVYTSGGMGLAEVLQVVFIVLKLCHIINWSWLWVLAPTWISLGLVLLILLIVFIVILIKG